MKKLITWQGDILKKLKLILVFFYFLFQTSNIFASERWVLDKSISTIEFELPVLFAKNVKGQFNTIEGFVELDVEKKENNKAIFSVQIDDLISKHNISWEWVKGHAGNTYNEKADYLARRYIETV